MGITFRIWPRETHTSDTDLSLSDRLKEISDEKNAQPPADEGKEPAEQAEAAKQAESAKQVEGESSSAAAQEPHAAAGAETDRQAAPADSAPAEDAAPVTADAGVHAEAAVTEPAGTANRLAMQTSGQGAIAVAVAEERPATRIATEPSNESQEGSANSFGNPPAETSAAGDGGTKTFRLPRWGSQPEALETAERDPEARQPQEQPAEARRESVPQAPSAQPFRQRFLERTKAAEAQAPQAQTRRPQTPLLQTPPLQTPKSAPFEKPEPPRPAEENSSAAVRQALAEMQSAQQRMEAEVRARLDKALAEFGRRMPAPLSFEDEIAQMEQRAKIAADNITREVQGQARVMLDAVASELRGFRDQFGKEIQERVAVLNRATQQAFQLKEKLEPLLPKTENLLLSLSSSQQEASIRLQTGSAALGEQLRASREALASETEAQGETLRGLARDTREDQERLKEELDTFRREAEAAGDVLARVADQSLERLKAGAEQAEAHIRAEMEKLATEVEARILSGGLVEKATRQIERAAQEVIEPVLERINYAGATANSSADSLNRTSQDVVGRLDAARGAIESRLDGLLSEQQALLQASMSGFQRQATEELGNLVERVVAESSEQLNDRLHAVFQDMLVSTSQQINGAARSTLGTLHQGLKQVFEPAAAEAESDSGAASAQN
jgi:hypothetical protein